MFELVTTFHEKHYPLYGMQMLRSFEGYLQDKIKLHVYYDGDTSIQTEYDPEKIVFHEFKKEVDMGNFIEYATPFVADKVTSPPNSKEYENQKMFYYDAIRFSYKVFVMLSHIKKLENKYMVWMDGDTIAHGLITNEWMYSLVEDNCISYLGRSFPYTETGFLIFNSDCDYFDLFWKRMDSLYNGKQIFKLEKYIDCVAFDDARIYIEKLGAKTNNLSVTETGHVWEKSRLEKRITHFKGLRKPTG